MNIRECVKCGKAIYGEVYYSTSAGHSHTRCKSSMDDGGAGEIHIERPIEDLRYEVSRLKELNSEVRNKLNNILSRVELPPSIQFDFDEVLRLLIEEEVGE